MPTAINEHTVSNKREYSCHGCGQPIKFDSNITSLKSGRLLNMNGEQHDCPNFNNKANNQERQSKSDIVCLQNRLSLQHIYFCNSRDPAFITRCNKKVVIHEDFLKSKGEKVVLLTSLEYYISYNEAVQIKEMAGGTNPNLKCQTRLPYSQQTHTGNVVNG